MRHFWRFSGCVGLVILMVMLRPAEASVDQYEVHWVDKSHNILQHVKRKAICKSDNYSLCPASVGGGCCPDNFACGTLSCYATTAGPTSACGKYGYYSCPLTAGAGSCCPVGLVCDNNGGCSPPPGVSVSQSCPASYFGCPVSLGGGCCLNGMVCGSGLCYDGTPRTVPVTEAQTTTDSGGHMTTVIVTSMTVITDGPNLSSSSATAAEIPQLIPSTVAKEDAIQTSDSSGGHGGLSSGALGGIVASVIVILVAIVVAAIFIVLRLKRTEKAVKNVETIAGSRHESSNGLSQSYKQGFGQPSVSEVDASTDVGHSTQFPIMRPSPQMRSQSASSVVDIRSSSRTPNFTNSGASSPPLWGMPFPSDASDGRQSSLDFYPNQDNGNVRMSQRVSIDSHGSYGHSRQPSDTSELEGTQRFELGTSQNEGVARQRSNSATRPPKAHVRRNSDLSGQNRGRADSNAATATTPLGTVTEIHELHGHYGPMHTAAGQTAAELSREPSSANSTPSHHDT
ncbi:hypothetical protein F5Y19DRAFT_212650 [Xylariaceae sp. FL1651]|nr:hypothetical protein F5Y19DRAFT_212650 [Xylariaceae sp. FL1651]